MGFRMHIKHKGKEYGGDHKLYGYKDVKKLTSFPILIPEIRRQWDVPTTYSGEYIYLVYFCGSDVTDDLVLDEDTYAKFADAYTEDLVNCFYNTEFVHYFINYIQKLRTLPGEKILSWY